MLGCLCCYCLIYTSSLYIGDHDDVDEDLMGCAIYLSATDSSGSISFNGKLKQLQLQ